MKALSIALLLISAPALAATTKLESTPCAPAQYCANVANSAAWDINNITWAPQYKRLTVSVDGDLYDSGLYAVTESALTSIPIYDAEGKQLLVTLTFTSYQTCGRYCSTHYTLSGGKIVR